MAASPAAPSAILATLLTGASRTETARQHGVTRHVVEQVAAQHRDDHPALRGPKPNRVPPPAYIPIPAWVREADLVADYYDTAALFDEFAAARHCRTLKREAESLGEREGVK